MRKNLFPFIFTIIMAGALLTGCGTKQEAADQTLNDVVAESTVTPEPTASSADSDQPSQTEDSENGTSAEIVTPATTPTEVPVVTATTMPALTEGAVETPTEVPTAEPTVTQAVEPTATPTVAPTSTPISTATPKPTETSMPTATSTPVPPVEPTSVPEPTATPTATATPKPTNTPVPTATSTPTPTPEPTEIPMVESTEASFEVKENEDGTVTITKYIDEVATIVTIPETIGGKKVTGIGREAFKGYSNLVIDTVDIGGMTLGVYAFRGVQINNLIISSEVNPYKITSNVYHNGASLSGAKVLHLEIKEGVQSIASYLFAACDWVTEVTLPDSVTSIGREAFGGCSNLTSINLDNVSHFDYEAFNECNNLVIDRLEIGGKTFSNQVFAEVTINTMVLSSSDGTYSDTTGSFNSAKVGKVEFGPELDAIPNHVFKGCEWLTEAELPGNVQSIGEHAFHNCSNLTGIVIPEGLNEIKEYAFCKAGITEIILPESLTTLEDGAFSACLNLKEISIPSGVTELQTSLFSGSKNLERVTVTDSVSKVRPYAFSNCDAVTIVAPEGSYMESYAVDREYSLETY